MPLLMCVKRGKLGRSSGENQPTSDPRLRCRDTQVGMHRWTNERHPGVNMMYLILSFLDVNRYSIWRLRVKGWCLIRL